MLGTKHGHEQLWANVHTRKTWSKRLAIGASVLILSASGFVPGGGVSAAMRSCRTLIISMSLMRLPIFLPPLPLPPFPFGAIPRASELVVLFFYGLSTLFSSRPFLFAQVLIIVEEVLMAMEIGTCTEKKETTKNKIHFSSLKKNPQSCKKVAKTRQVETRLQ